MHRFSLQAVVLGVTVGTTPHLAARSTAAASAKMLDVRVAACAVPGVDASAANAWNRARLALEASLPTADQNPPTLHVIRYDRVTDVARTRVEEQTLIDSTLTAASDLPVRADAREYAALGYRDAGTDRAAERFFAPSANGLLDSSFTSTHCVSLAPVDARRAGEIGVAFAPRANDGVTLDVVGTVWIASDAPTLHSIEFRYQSAALPASDSAAGGSVHFERAANGRTFAARWELHLPAVVRRVVTDGAASVAPAGNGAGIRDLGSEVVSAAWADGTRWEADLPALRGRVVAAGSGVPLPGVVVGLRGTRMQVRTDSSGGFQLPPVVPGAYALDAVDDGLADFEVSSAATAILVVGRVRNPPPITLVMRSRSAAVDTLCADSWMANPGVPLGPALLLGHVTLPSGAPAVGALVRAFWTDSSGGTTSPVRLGGRSDSTGTFQMCGMPTDKSVRLTATLDSLVSVDTTVTAHDDGDVRRVALQLTTLRDPRLGAYRHRYLLVTGIDSAPLPGVDVNDGVFGTPVGRTGANGRVALGGLGEGNTLLELRKLGYEQRTLVVQTDPSDTLPVRVQLRTATQLAAVKVTAQVTLSQIAVASGLEERMKMGFGQFFGPKDIVKYQHLALDVSLSALGLTVLPLSDFMPGRIGGGAGEVLVGGHGAGRCPVSIYIDGLLFYEQRPGAGPPPDATLWTTGDFAAAEYYADEALAPPEFVHATAGKDFCGALLLWTRDR